MISIDLYYQFLPHWAGDIIVNNLKKSIESLGLSWGNSYIYPHLISCEIDLKIHDHPIDPIKYTKDLKNNYDNIMINYNHILMEKSIPQDNPQEFINNLSIKHPQNTIEIIDNHYKIIHHYETLKELLETIILRTINCSNFPKNIFWSNWGNHTNPRPLTGYGYRYNTNEYGAILYGHIFPIEQYYEFSFNHLETNEEKLKNLNDLINTMTKEYAFYPIDEDYKNMIIRTYYNPQVIIDNINDYDLHEEFLLTCLKHHNDAILMGKDDKYYFLAFIHCKSENPSCWIDIIQGYSHTIDIRLKETAYYLQLDKKYSLSHWMKSLENIMFFENKIHWGHKKQTIKILLKYLLDLKSIEYDELLLEELSWYLLDINSRLVQEFNNLNGFVALSLLPFQKKHHQNIIYDFFKENYDNCMAGILRMAHNIYDTMMMLGLGAIMTPHKDPYNLKRPMDQWLQLSIKYEITINLKDLWNIFNQEYNIKLLEKSTNQLINNRWSLIINPVIAEKYSGIVGYEPWNQWQFYNKIHEFIDIKKRIGGFLKKTDNINADNHILTSGDSFLMNQVEILISMDNYGDRYQWLKNNYEFINEYFNDHNIQDNCWRKNIIGKIYDIWN